MDNEQHLTGGNPSESHDSNQDSELDGYGQYLQQHFNFEQGSQNIHQQQQFDDSGQHQSRDQRHQFEENIPRRMVGQQSQNPVYDVKDEPYPYLLTNIERLDDRERAIIMRANWATQLNLLIPLDGFDYLPFTADFDKAIRQPPGVLGINESPPMLSKQDFLDAYPFTTMPTNPLIQIENIRQSNNVMIGKDRSYLDFFDDGHRRFLRSHVYWTLIASLCRLRKAPFMRKITKIVGLNLGWFCWDLSCPQKLRNQSKSLESISRYAALFTMRDFFSTQGGAKSKDSPLQIYVHDHRIRRQEKDILEKRGIKVLCSAYGHQQGYAAVDPETVVVIGPSNPYTQILGLILEITTPVIIFSASVKPNNQPIASRGCRFTSQTTGKQLTLPTQYVHVDYKRLQEDFEAQPVLFGDRAHEQVPKDLFGSKPAFYVRSVEGTKGVKIIN